MSVEEFEHWAVMYRSEGWMPRAQQLRHAQLLAVTLQGPSTRKGRGPWLTGDFLQPDPWVAPPPRKAMKGPDLLAYARNANARRGK